MISHVPALVRSRDRLIGIGEPVLPRYERIAFEKSLVAQPGQPLAAFVTTSPSVAVLPAYTKAPQAHRVRFERRRQDVVLSQYTATPISSAVVSAFTQNRVIL